MIAHLCKSGRKYKWNVKVSVPVLYTCLLISLVSVIQASVFTEGVAAACGLQKLT